MSIGLVIFGDHGKGSFRERGGGSLGGSSSPRLGGTSNIYESISRTSIRGHWMPVKKLAIFELLSTVWPSGTHFPGGGIKNRNNNLIEIHINLFYPFYNVE